MWKIWLLFDPRRALVATAIFAFAMVMLLHFIVLSSSPYYGGFLGWGGGAEVSAVSTPVDSMLS
ncbi:MAG: light-harvesting antenna LH1, alpha subunit [Pseudomonadota bacterium]